MNMKSFASDNYSGICPEIVQAILEANNGHAIAYGGDNYTEKALALFSKTFGETTKTYFVYNGTAANTLALKAMTRSHHAIIAPETAHILTNEVAAPVSLTGCPIIPAKQHNGKITAISLEEAYLNITKWGRHNSLPKVVSLAQTTEYGTIYTIEELKAISAICKKYHLFFHMDGCRLSNAAVAKNISLKAFSKEVGVDVLSFGGTKNGLLFGEAIVFFNAELAKEFEYIQKQGLQLHSKMRFLSAQFIPYLENNLWYKNAQHANTMCQKLAEKLSEIPEITFAFPVESNQIFAYFPPDLIKATQEKFPFYVWDEATHLVRLVTNFDTTEEDINKFSKICRDIYPFNYKESLC